MKRKVYYALDREVLAVAIEGSVNDWAAYIGAVAGDNHEREAEEIVNHGSKLSHAIATLLFPEFEEEFSLRWRE